ncbi:PTS lactose/cellobiose transporter subunit IIA [Listeria welshimeri]|uniref:PTS lactose/cellobiose transporter subunit IIA n=1 Tax=Listeria welshimeri TaxID=1643 RepID=UPI001627833D|nr:PTS lactose/cellobiose transporter subunit IIA [Listeria welshimeri]MBC1478206.1 PTS lactose/cellobiose transporter subunit IIA [Listeria welshimeri]MBC1981023.1 PTS lactose/cellobiose transporter subunit IIA [Listeria welshimeri]MBC2010188.1 PTS lactose/cellobiose transporter subunit IIA [Listeria welshimeri]MBC2043493.1 PTS lactose/cellobiose transporter subunit IIA [Listeria welshimeri]MBF2351653.1 PTS lactose/cellobiose transporter subunit IIA [Listeria welshimeri]
MNDLESQIAMELIFHSGNAKSTAMQAIIKAESDNIVEGKELIKQARKELNAAHSIQTKLMTDEMNGNTIEKTILLIHAQDHFMAATLTIDLGERMIKLHGKISSR